MATIYTHYDKNIRRTWILMTVFMVVVIGLGWGFSWYFDAPEILIIAVAFAFFQTFISYWFSDKIVLSMSGAHPVSRESHRELYNIVENLCITAGLPVPKIYLINDPAPNAFATGRDPKHAAVAFTTGLLQQLNRTELEGVAAHELAHIGNRDMLVMTIAVMLVGFVTLLSDFFIRMSIFGGGRDSDNRGGGQLQLILVVVGVLMMILAPLFASLIQMAISRKREFLADASGALLTRYPEGLASALEKISSYNRPMDRANHATAHLFIANPFGAKARRGLNKLFMTHPPVEDRIRALRNKTDIN